MPLQIKLHGGGCCGIKTIVGFWGNAERPAGLEKPILARSCPSSLDDNVAFIFGCGEENWFFPEKDVPQETAHERLKRYIAWLREIKNGSLIIEVVLTEHQTLEWHDVLEEEGFEQVCDHLNGGSYNQICIYYMYVKPLPKTVPEKSLRDA